MHIPDGIIDGATSAGFGAAAVGGFGAALRRTRDQLTERQIPLSALAAAFVFAAQMVNFPVIAGMSGHLLGGVLAAVVVGPAAGVIIVSVVLLVQALLFADGGLTALGLNVVNMALVGGLGGYFVFSVLRSIVPRSVNATAWLAGIAAFVSLPLAALAFVIQFSIGGTADVAFGTLLWSMLGTHLLIGIGEGVITFFVVGAIVASRPDLVFGLRPVVPVREG